jgi:hypothetical protein
MTDQRWISREEAEDALLRQDWSPAWHYWADLFESGGPALEWLETMEAAILPHAEAGNLLAQQNLGSIGHMRYMSGLSADLEPLRSGLTWIVAAQRQKLSVTGMEMLVEGYRALRKKGVRDTGIEDFLSQPEPTIAWRRWTGRELLSE